MDYIQFKKSFDTSYKTLELPAECKELDLSFYPASSLVWWLEWYLQFDDKKYARLWERYDRYGGMINMSRRVSLAYHYGPVMRVGADKLPAYDAKDPVDIRIDNSCQPIHLHLGAPLPHYPQSRIDGLQLTDLDTFDFVRAILSHRASGKTIQETLGFVIK